MPPTAERRPATNEAAIRNNSDRGGQGQLNRLARRRARQYARAFQLYRPDPRPDPRVDEPITARTVHSWRSAVMHLRAHGYDVVWAVPAPILDAARQMAA